MSALTAALLLFCLALACQCEETAEKGTMRPSVETKNEASEQSDWEKRGYHEELLDLLHRAGKRGAPYGAHELVRTLQAIGKRDAESHRLVRLVLQAGKRGLPYSSHEIVNLLQHIGKRGYKDDLVRLLNDVGKRTRDQQTAWTDAAQALEHMLHEVDQDGSGSGHEASDSAEHDHDEDKRSRSAHSIVEALLKAGKRSMIGLPARPLDLVHMLSRAGRK